MTSMNSRKEPCERSWLARTKRRRARTCRPAVEEQQRDRFRVLRVVGHKVHLEWRARVFNRRVEVVDRVDDLLALSPAEHEISGGGPARAGRNSPVKVVLPIAKSSSHPGVRDSVAWLTRGVGGGRELGARQRRFESSQLNVGERGNKRGRYKRRLEHFKGCGEEGERDQRSCERVSGLPELM